MSVLKHTVMFLSSFLLLFSCYAKKADVVDNKDIETDEQRTWASIETMAIINSERQAKKLKALQADSSFICAAQKHVIDIGVNKKCSHTGTDGSSLFARAKRCSFILTEGVETIACGKNTSRQAVDGWIESDKQIIFNENYTRFGCDIKDDYWVCVFGF